MGAPTAKSAMDLMMIRSIYLLVFGAFEQDRKDSVRPAGMLIHLGGARNTIKRAIFEQTERLCWRANGMCGQILQLQ